MSGNNGTIVIGKMSLGKHEGMFAGIELGIKFDHCPIVRGRSSPHGRVRSGSFGKSRASARLTSGATGTNYDALTEAQIHALSIKSLIVKTGASKTFNTLYKSLKT